jgi:chromosome segregation ATPase
MEIGTSGAETNSLISDVDQMSRFGDRISNARNAAKRTVPAQVEMYKSIEPDVEQLNSVLTRLRNEYATYDNKYPSLHDTIAKALGGVETGLKRMNLLRQQIATAKELADIDDADEQFRKWQTQMQPLLDRESELDATK